MDKIILENIKDTFMQYKDKECDELFFHKIISEINKDSFIDGCIKLQRPEVNEESLCVQVGTTIIKADIERYKKKIEEYLPQWLEVYPENRLEIYNYFYLHFIFHEVEHIRQALYSLYNKNKYQEINDLYKLLDELFLKAGYFQMRKYEKKGESFSFERSANIYSYETMLEVTENEIQKNMAKIEFLFVLLNGYDIKWGKITSPVYDTLRWLGYKNKFKTSSDIPFFDRIANGLDITLKEYIYLIEPIGERSFVESDYDIVKERIRTIRKCNDARDSRS